MTVNNLWRWLRRGYSQEEAQALVDFARSERLRLASFSRGTGKTSAEKLNHKRFVKGKVQKILRPFNNHQPLNISKQLMVSSYRESHFANGFFPKRARTWLPISRRVIRGADAEIDLKSFSFIHNPVGTIRQLGEILKTEAVELRARLNFLDERCNDIGAFLVLQAVRQAMVPVFSGGRMTSAIQKVIDAVELRSALKMATFNSSDATEVWPFPLHQRRAAGTSKSVSRHVDPQTKELVADRFLQTVNRWLDLVAKQRLNSQGRRLVLKLIGETLDNAERHSEVGSDDGGWSITGYLAREPNGTLSVYKVYLAFLSVGASIAESIATGPAHTRERMNRYVRQHAGREFADEQLMTVFALQDGVTKNHEAAKGRRGGTGMQDVFEFFADLGDTRSGHHEAQLTIISGATCINLKAPYMRGSRKDGDESEREVWFNAQNVPSVPPDKDHVFGLPGRLNGTLVTMVIALDPDYLKETADDNPGPRTPDEGRSFELGGP